MPIATASPARSSSSARRKTGLPETLPGIHESLAPSAPLETDIAQSIADDRWRLKRAAAIENNIFALGLDEPDQFTAHHENRYRPRHGPHLARAGQELQLLTPLRRSPPAPGRKEPGHPPPDAETAAPPSSKLVEESELLAQLAASKGESYDPESISPANSLPPQFDFSTTQIARLAARHRLLAEAKKHLQAPPKSLRARRVTPLSPARQRRRRIAAPRACASVVHWTLNNDNGERGQKFERKNYARTAFVSSFVQDRSRSRGLPWSLRSPLGAGQRRSGSSAASAAKRLHRPAAARLRVPLHRPRHHDGPRRRYRGLREGSR